ncbi:hypothetical protein F5Y14DRAFT_148356 [Nemania sp. NC0429]|nr:hypothetical protein F5Y14DRAFT_148356 [Nemania sp. NC0429]
MARDPESAPITSDLSLSDLLGDTKIRHRLVKILKAQKELLNRPDAWASVRSQRPNGFINVPPEVLEQVKTSFIRRKQATGSPKAAASPGHTTGRPEIPASSGTQSSPPPGIGRKGDHEDDDTNSEDDGQNGDGDDHGTPISWSMSSEQDSTPSSPSVEGEEARQPFITQLPEGSSPPRPTIVTSQPQPPSRLPALPVIPAFPHSSQEPEDELEVEIPTALAHNPEPINISALPMLATPPSAQVVPCTFEQSTASTNASAKLGPQPKPHVKKHIYKRVPELYRGPKQSAPSSHLNTKTVVPNRNSDVGSSLSTDNTSSSIIPATSAHVTAGKQHTTVHDAGLGRIPADDTHANHNPDLHSPVVPRRHSPVHVPTSPSLAIRSPPPLAPYHATPQPAAAKSWEAPFVHYTITYPGYSGSIEDFVTACIYIQLQYRRIRTSLYDDFIRAWVEGYLPYVRDCDDAQPPRRALRAIEWYNEIDDDPLFTSRVVTRQNLQSILKFYPKEVEMAQSSLNFTPRQGPSQYRVSSHYAEPFNDRDIHMPSTSPTYTPQLKGKEPMRNSVELAEPDTRRSKPSPIPKPRFPAPTAGQHMPTHRSFNGIETRPARSEGFARSFSESTAHKKRVAPTELDARGAKRISLGPTSVATHNRMRSDSGSAAGHSPTLPKNPIRSSAIPDSRARRQGSAKATEDPEERRRRRLAKHFKKRMAEMESIASSASPLRNTPTSAQK